MCIDINEATNNDTVKMVQEEGNVAFGFQCDVSDCAHVESIARQANRKRSIFHFRARIFIYIILCTEEWIFVGKKLRESRRARRARACDAYKSRHPIPSIIRTYN